MPVKPKVYTRSPAERQRDREVTRARLDKELEEVRNARNEALTAVEAEPGISDQLRAVLRELVNRNF